MESPHRGTTVFRVGDWTVQTASCRIERGGVQRHLRPMLMDMLVLLTEHAGSVVSKEEILSRVWDNRVVSESTLSRDVAMLRRLLDDDAHHPRYIETISKRGFRLLAPVLDLEVVAQRRVAVLPFANLDRDDANDFLADGFADALTTELAHCREFFVISRQSMLRFKGSSRTAPDIAAELRASALVEGSLARLGDRIRISVQLLDAASDGHLWADAYEDDYSAVLADFGRIAFDFANAVRAVLAPDSVNAQKVSRDVAAATRVEYLKYRYHFLKWTEEGIHKGLAHLRQAMELDPSYSEAWAGLAWSLSILGYWGFMPIAEAYPRAKAAATHALALDPSSEAHAASALTAWLYDWDLRKAEEEIGRSLEMNPSNDSAQFLRALFAATMKRDREAAVAETQRLLELDPISVMTNFAAAYILVFAGAYDEGAARARRTMALFPDSPWALCALGFAELGRHDARAAMTAFEEALTITPNALLQTYLAFARGRNGDREGALALFDELGKSEELAPYASALIHAGLGEYDRAFECLERTFADRDSRIFWFRVVPGLDALRADGRFEELMKRVDAACIK